MKISAQFSFWAGLLFMVIAFSYATWGLSQIHPDMTPVEVGDAHGFAMFWYFLGAVSGLMALVSWLMLKGKLGAIDG